MAVKRPCIGFSEYKERCASLFTITLTVRASKSSFLISELQSVAFCGGHRSVKRAWGLAQRESKGGHKREPETWTERKSRQQRRLCLLQTHFALASSSSSPRNSSHVVN